MSAGGVRAACTAPVVASLPLRAEGGHLFTEATVEGRSATMLVDTGAAVSALDAGFAKTLPRSEARGGTAAVVGIGGIDRRSFRSRTVRRIELGPLVVEDLPLVAGDLRRGRPTGAVRLDGLLGTDVLARYDVEFDPRAGHLLLHVASGCAPGQRERPAGSDAVPLVPLFQGRLWGARVTLDGHVLTALIDTGATQSLLFAGAVRRLGVGTSRDDQKGFGLGATAGRKVPVRLHRFARLQLGAVAVDGPRLALAPTAPLDLDMVLGLDVLGNRGLWLSFATNTLFLRP